MIRGAQCTLAIQGHAIVQAGTVKNFEWNDSNTPSAPQPIEAMPRRERHWLAGYLEIKDWESKFEPTFRQAIKRCDISWTGTSSIAWWRMGPAASSFFGRPCQGRLRHSQRIGEEMCWRLSKLSGDPGYVVEEIISTYAIINHPTPAQWRRIWTGE